MTSYQLVIMMLFHIVVTKFDGKMYETLCWKSLFFDFSIFRSKVLAKLAMLRTFGEVLKQISDLNRCVSFHGQNDTDYSGQIFHL